MGAIFGLVAAIVGPLTHQVPIKRAVGFAAIALVMLAGAALQIALGRKARRITAKWDVAGPPGGVDRSDR